jgi:hypothetical protein
MSEEQFEVEYLPRRDSGRVGRPFNAFRVQVTLYGFVMDDELEKKEQVYRWHLNE